jgi:nucleoside recognition membrane protein YjiH
MYELHLICTVFIEIFILLVAYHIENLRSDQYFMFVLCPCSITAAGHCFSYFQSLVMSLFRPVTYKSVSGSYMNLQITWWICHVWGLKSCGMWCCVFRNQSPVDSVTSKIMWILNNTKLKLNSVALVRERTIPTERPPPVGEVSANFCG